MALLYAWIPQSTRSVNHVDQNKLVLGRAEVKPEPLCSRSKKTTFLKHTSRDSHSLIEFFPNSKITADLEPG